MLKTRNTPFKSTIDTMPRSLDVPSLESSSIGGYRRCLVRRLLDSGRRLRVRAGHLPRERDRSLCQSMGGSDRTNDLDAQLAHAVSHIS